MSEVELVCLLLQYKEALNDAARAMENALETIKIIAQQRDDAIEFAEKLLECRGPILQTQRTH